MTTPTTVWVVEQGEYSDYRVVGVFSSEANARRIAADAINTRAATDAYSTHMAEGATVAEWPLDPAVEELRQGYSPYIVVMLEDGTIERISRSDVSGYEVAGEVSMWRRTKAPAYIGRDIPDALMATIWAKDETHAIKIANEHRARLIASGEWAVDRAKP